MANPADLMRKYITLTESYVGPQSDNPHVKYEIEETRGKITKIRAVLSRDTSGRFTKLGRDLNRIMELREEIARIEEEAKQASRELIAEMFNASDAVYTREIETVNFLFQISKDPEPAKTVKYAKVLDAFQKHLTPSLLHVLESIKANHTTITQREPSLLKHVDKAKVKAQTTESIINEGMWDKIKETVRKFAASLMRWVHSYDAKLEQCKRLAYEAGFEG